MMTKTLTALGCAALFAAPAFSNPPPPQQADPISVTRTSPSVIGFGNTPADIYGEAVGGGAGGWDVGGPGPVPHVPDVNYGLQPLADNNDGHSGGELDVQAPVVIYFSGDVNSVGQPGTEYDHQAQRIQAAGDRFVTNGAANVGPRTVMMLGGPTFIGGPVLPGTMGTFPLNMLSANQTVYNEIPTLPPMIYNHYVPPQGATPMDDMDAVELLPFDLNGDLIHDLPIYFTLDAQSPSLTLFPGGSGADVLVSPPGQNNFGLFAPAPQLGLSPADEVDALAVWDVNGDLVADQNPLTDFALFSLAPGSPSLAGPDLIVGTADDLSAADIFVTDFSGINMLYLPSTALGMLPTDNIDAIDVEIWVDASSIEIFEEIWEVPAVQGDLDGDGFVGLNDLDLILNNWNLTVPPGDPLADPNGDGFIGLADLDIVLNNWNNGVPPPASTIPEPATAVLLLAGGLALVRRKH